MANVRGAGDPIRLVDRRGDTYADFVHYITSTPSEGPSDVELDPDSGLEFWAEIDASEISSTIWRLWQSGTRYHWAWPCPHCAEYFIPRFRGLIWDKPKSPDGRVLKSNSVLAKQTARLVCPRCGSLIDDALKEEMNRRGVYVAPGQSVSPNGEVIGLPPDTWTISYWVSGLCSPFKTWGDRAAEYVDAVRSGEPSSIQAVVNGSFGELFAPGSGEVPEWRELERLKDEAVPYVMGEVPSWVRFVTLAADVQKDRIIYGIRGWGPRSTSCLINIGELWGPTAEEEVWEDFETVLADSYDGHPIKLALIDSGFRPGNPKQVPENRVYSFCQRQGRVARPTRGRDTLVGRPLRISQIEARVNWRGKLEVVGLELFLIDTDHFKRAVHERLRWPVDQPGAFLLPQDVPDFYLQQLVSEARVRKAGGRATWIQRSRENHFFDVEAMQAAAGWFLGAQRLFAADEERAPKGRPTTVVPRPSGNKMAGWSQMLNR
jgi:phage terminase large subunit GpA-like protein